MSMPHRLDPLLKPASIAVLGASERAGAVGRATVENLLKGKYAGRLYAVNPGYARVCGVPCYPSLAELPEPVEHVIFAIGDARVEAALDDAIAHGARATTIMSALELPEDRAPRLRERVAARIRSSGLLLCGANGMGFYNFRDGVWACGFATRTHRRDGTIAYISQSGSGMSGIVDVDERLDFNLVVSTGQELAVTLEDYLDYALAQLETRVVGLFLETSRNPAAMIRALEKARERRIPVVALKVGRTELSAHLARSHSGAIAGCDASYQALFDRYGVQRVEDMDQLATALIMFAQPHPVASGGLVALHDSGGERQLLIDLADREGVPLAKLAPQTIGRLEALLDPGLPAVNPLDAWSKGGPDYHRVMEDCFAALMSDPNAACGAVVHDRAPDSGIHDTYIGYLRQGHAASGKPAFLVANRQGTGTDPLAVAATREGFPVLDGLASFLHGIRCLLDYRDFCQRTVICAPQVSAAATGRWRARLGTGAVMLETEAGEMLGDFGIPVNRGTLVTSEAEARAAAAACGSPVVLKTAEKIEHKSDVDGVVLGLGDPEAVAAAYRQLSARLGPRALVAPMITRPGVEMLLGLTQDQQFGPLVALGFGGAHVEALGDVVFGLPPFDAATARRMLERLKLRRLLDSRRFRHGLALEEFCEIAARFSAMAAELADVLAEIDVNPVIVHADGCVAVDALVVGRCGSVAGQSEARRAI
jgi:acyl-CoA synthetase (NDP forming)